jgi:hypothetical protein
LGEKKMKRLSSVFSIYLAMGLMVLGSFAQANAQTMRNERDVRDVLRSINSKVDDFRYSVGNDLRRSSSGQDAEDEIKDGLKNLQDSLRNFDDKFQRRRENGEDVADVLRSAKYINDTLNINRVNSNRIQNNWLDIRTLLDRLASNYGVRWNWDNQNGRDSIYNSGDNRFPNDNRPAVNYPSTRTTSSSVGLSGTYKLDASRSENTREIADRAIADSRARNDNSAQRDLESKLESPEQITIDVRGNQVTLSSSRAAPITFTADGRDRSENSGGKTIRVRATLRGQELTVSSLGSENDFTVVFASIDNGNAMRVTRRITTDYLSQTVFAESIYQKTDSLAQTDDNSDSNDGYSSSDQDTRNNYPSNYPTTTNGRTGQFIVRDGTILTGILENDIDAGVSQNNDRFRMTVQAPNEYRGAVIEGYLSGISRSGKVTGRSQITFNFERIKLASGQTYDFAGFLQNVTDENGKIVKVDTEGTARGNSQTKETVKRGGIGAGIGAIIGAVIGGAPGAAVGAVIGGAGGAGSVVLQGKDDLRLRKGSSITVQSSSPIR